MLQSGELRAEFQRSAPDFKPDCLLFTSTFTPTKQDHKRKVQIDNEGRRALNLYPALFVSDNMEEGLRKSLRAAKNPVSPGGGRCSSNFSRQSCLQSMHKSDHFTNSPMLTSHRSHELENVSLKRSKPRNQPHNNQTEHKSALSYARAQKQQGACQGMVLSSGGSCQTPISTEGVASCMMQTGVWEVEDEKNLNQRSE